jgi:hypothetical protein
MTTAVAPTIVTLDGLQLADTLRAGIYRLFEKTDHINKINVFPGARRRHRHEYVDDAVGGTHRARS